MAIEVLMPKWGLTMKEGRVSRWFKSEGDSVSAGEPLFEVETSKITNTVESPGDGILFQILVPAGMTVPVQTVVALLAGPGETPERREVMTDAGSAGDVPASEAKGAAKETGGGEKPFVRATPLARRLAKEKNIDLSQVDGTGPGGRITEEDVRRHEESKSQGPKISPQALKLAREVGVDPAAVTGSGPGGRITKVDILRAMHPAGGQPGSPSPAGRAGQAGSGIRAGETIPLTGMRQLIADNMMASLHNSAQLTVFVEIDATEAIALRDGARAKYDHDESVRISLNDIISLAVCRALRDHPVMNSWLVDDNIVVHDHVNLGLAVALPDGLIVPNVKDAHRKGLLELSTEIRSLAARARSGGLTMDDIQGGTFTISNVGMLGVDGFTPILNPPETAILGVGRAVEKPAVHRGEICIRNSMTLSLTFDHRVVDGAPAMAFLRSLADLLENPVMMLA